MLPVLMLVRKWLGMANIIAFGIRFIGINMIIGHLNIDYKSILSGHIHHIYMLRRQRQLLNVNSFMKIAKNHSVEIFTMWNHIYQRNFPLKFNE